MLGRKPTATGEPTRVSRATPPEIIVSRDYPELLQRVPAIVYIAGTGEFGRWHYVSPQIRTILGYTAEDWCADPTLWAARLHPDDRDEVIAREIAGGLEEAGVRGEEYRLLHRDGTVVWVRDEGELFTAPNGEVLWQGVLTNITAHKLFEAELELRAAQQAAVAMLGEHALEGASTNDLIEEAVATAARLLDCENAVMLELMPDQEAFRIVAHHGVAAGLLGATVPASLNTAPGYTMRTRTPAVVEDWEVETRYLAPAASLGLRSGICVLIEGAHGTFGILSVQSLRARRYRSDEVDFLQALANVLADALERQATDDDIRHRALHDPLTGLPNRVLFRDRVEQALARLRRHGGLTAILLLDLDHFQVLNDSLGHGVGDELLAAAAPRLRHALRSSDTVARFGGDEFAVLLEEIAGESDAIDMAERLAGLFTRPFIVGGSEHFVGSSIGIALGYGGERPAELIRDADAALHRAKERGRGRYEVFDEAMRSRALARLRVENDLRRALERDELRLDYQPVVALNDGTIAGVEALLRWDHPHRGTISPSDFIPVAEENGLIEPIGRWVLEHACRQAAAWHAANPDARPIEMAVNISAVQLTTPGLVDTVRTTLRSTGLDPACLWLEITETAMLREPEATIEVLKSLCALGIRVALDDFGNGYSSLSYLPQLPLDALKIDRSFIDGLGEEPHDTVITEAIIAMSHALSLTVVAEGVECARQQDALRRQGCELAQGFYFSHPVGPEAITRMWSEGPAWLRGRSGQI